MKIYNYLAVGALVASVGALSGCGGDTASEPTSDNQPTISPSASPDVDETTLTADNALASGDITAPGTVLAIGEDAIVDYRVMTFPNGLDQDGVLSPSGDLLMRVSVTSMTPAAFSDLPSGTIFTGATEDDLSVVAVRYEAQAVGTPAISMERRGIGSDFDPEGWNAHRFSNSRGEIAGCINPLWLGTEFDNGETVQGCFLLVYATVNGTPNMTFKPYGTDLYDNPLVWTAPPESAWTRKPAL